MSHHLLGSAILLLYVQLTLSHPCLGDEQAAFNSVVKPYLQTYCVACHNAQKARGELDLTQFRSPQDIISHFRRWQAVIEFVEGGEMPPEDSQQPSLEESRNLVNAVRAVLISEARKQAGDPGIVLPRRLSNTEYDLSIRDLTGINIHPTHDFPPDPAAGEGFDNTGEALSMSPSLVKKYLSAAQRVADHLVLRTDGLSFAPFPVTSWNDRRTLAENAVIQFYQQHDITVPEYLTAAWRYHHRAPDLASRTPQEFAASAQLSQTWFPQLYHFLSGLNDHPSCPAELQQAWTSLPAPASDSDRPPELNRLIDLVERYRRDLHSPEGELIKPNAGNWPIGHLADRARTASARRQYTGNHFRPNTLLRTPPLPAADRLTNPVELSLWIRLEPAFNASATSVVIRNPLFSKADQLPRNPDEAARHEVQTLRNLLESATSTTPQNLRFGEDVNGDAAADSFILQSPALLQIPLSTELQRTLAGKRLLLQAELASPPETRTPVLIQVELSADAPPAATGQLLADPNTTAMQHLKPFATDFCSTIPSRFCYVDRGRGLSAGFHLVEGFFRDDRPLIELALTELQRQQLDQLWAELDFITESAETLLRGFVWFERSEREVLHDPRFDFLRSEDPELIQPEMLDRFEKLYLDKLGIKRLGDSLEPEQPDERYRIVHGFFTTIRDGLQRHNSLLEAAAAKGLQDLLQIAARAWRHPLTAEQQTALAQLYHKLRDDGQKPEQALRGVLLGILMSPEFSYLYFPAPKGPGPQPLPAESLASRLSYFLWSSIPDQPLLQTAANGSLLDDQQLRTQTQRMLQDPRIAAFAGEFFGQWLRYRDYPARDPVNAAAFKWYDDSLRAAMAEEPVRVFTTLLQQDRPLTELISGDSTLLNERLAQHYGGLLEQNYRRARDARQQQLASNGLTETQQQAAQLWLPVAGLREAGRGGLFGMAVVLAKNSAGDRTSPVKRGFWSVHHLLGQHFPPPPADVPELPKSEATSDRTIRELLLAHVADAQCNLCHRHFDSLGLALEGFDATGRTRSQDLAGRPIDNTAVLPDGSRVTGVSGLADYVLQQRRDDFTATLCRRFLGYALGRSVQLSDEPLLDELQTALEHNQYRPSVLFEKVVLSPQFRRIRGQEQAP
jgi:hypothetical protein